MTEASWDSDATFDTITRILKGATQAGASDVHFRAGVRPMVRLDGEMCPLDHPALGDDTIIGAMTVLSNYAGVRPDFTKQSDFDFSCQVPEVGRFRVHTYRQRGTQALVLRHIPAAAPDFSELRMPPVIKKVADQESGLVFVTGNSGHGRSTTLASILAHINRSYPAHIVTVERPIEFLFVDDVSTFSQREVGRDVSSYEEGLTAATREDADIVFVTELKSRREVELALQIAESGRLVLSALSAPNVTRAISWLINLFPVDDQESIRHRLSYAVSAIVAQHLLPKKNEHTRVLVTEMMLQTMVTAECIRDAAKLKTLYVALDKARTDRGTHSFDHQLQKLVRDGEVDLDAARGLANNPAELARKR